MYNIHKKSGGTLDGLAHLVGYHKELGHDGPFQVYDSCVTNEPQNNVIKLII